MRDPSQGAALQLRGLVKRFPNTDHPAVDGIDLAVEPGEFMTFLGPSGSGKTTTLNMIAGFEPVDGGSVLIAGADVTAVPAHRRDIGMVFQHYALFPHLTVAANIAFPLQRRRVPRPQISDRVAEALRLVRLSEFADRYPRQLSGGQQQRVAVARAVVYNPRVLLMDEPLGALDKRLRESLQIEIARLHREIGLTVVYVTHDQEEALGLSDRVAVFDAGRIVQVGTPRELYEQPATIFVAQFLGDSTVVRGRLSSDQAELRGPGCRLAVPSGAAMPGDAPAALVIRPERLQILAPAAAAPPGCNVLGATVTDTVYLGSDCKVILRLPWGTTGVVRDAAHRLDVQRGAEVRVAWRVDDAAVVPDGSAPDLPDPAASDLAHAAPR